MRHHRPPCPHCKGTGNEPGTERMGRETDRCGGYSMEIMEAEDYNSENVVKATKSRCMKTLRERIQANTY